ncbi:MAG: glycosyltransferase family 39 protein [Thiohalocapsa sp.]|nr:glycosyltransferase family 39 protein [Thiohalocapsa sp.]
MHAQPLTSAERWLIVGLFLYFLLQALMRATGAAALELDESELAVVGQWWLAGYTNQPPLYVWLQAATFRVLGLDLAALSVLKNTLLFTTYLLTFLAARRLLHEPIRAILATLSLLLIAQLAWEAQRDLSHSVMVTTVAAASFYALLRWYERPSTAGYLLLGVLLGLGLLSKYNYVLFAGAVLLTLLTVPRGRALLFDPRLLLTLLVASALVAPHLVWLLGDPGLVADLPHKLDFGQRTWLVSGLGSTLVAMVDFLAPWWVIMLLVFRRDFLRAVAAPQHADLEFPLRRYLGALLLLLAVLLLLGASHFKARWMLPLVLVAPIYVFGTMAASALTRARVRAYIATALTAAALVLAVMGWRLHDWPLPAGRQALAEHFDAVAEQAREIGFENGLIISERLLDAGNLRLRFPGSTGWAPRVNGAALTCAGGDLLVVWDTEGRDALPPELRDLLVDALGVPPGEIDAALPRAFERAAARTDTSAEPWPALLALPARLGPDCHWTDGVSGSGVSGSGAAKDR